MEWNPDAPDVIGMQYQVRNEPEVGPSLVMAAGATGIAQTMPSTVTETVSVLGAYLAGGSSSFVFLAEVLAAGGEVPAGFGTQVFRPNGSANVSPTWTSSEPVFVDGINGAVLDYAKFVVTTTDLDPTPLVRSFDLEFPTAGALNGKRILDVRLNVVAALNNLSTTYDPTLYVTANSKFMLRPVTAPYGYNLEKTYQDNTGEIERATGQPWTVAQIQSMDTSAYRFRVTASMPTNPGGTTPASWTIYQVWIEVDYCDENRLTTQVVVGGNTSPGWASWVPRKPDATANWGKVSGSDFTMLLRQPRYGTLGPVPGRSMIFSVPYMRGFQNVPVVGLALTPALPLLTDGRATTGGEVIPTDTIAVYVGGGGGQSVDAQPYARIAAVEVAGTVEQEVSGASVQSYTSAVVPIRYGGAPGPLTVTLKRRSDNVTVATGQITTAEWDELPDDPTYGAWRVAQIDFAAPIALAVGVQYYLTFASSGAGSWYVQYLGTDTTTGVGSYGGLTNRATYDGSDQQGDITAMVITPIDPLTGVDAEPVGCAA